MNIYYNKHTETYMLKKDLLEELDNELGIKIEPMDNGNYTRTQRAWIEFILDAFIDDYFDVLSPEDLIENDETDILDELGIDYDMPEYRELEGPFHELQDENGNVYGG